MRPIAFPAVAAALILSPVPAAAQMDWLTPHLETKRNDNIRRHQQRTAGTGTEAEAAQSQQRDETITMAQRQAAWSRHKAEYRRRLLREGQAGADNWLDQQIRAGR